MRKPPPTPWHEEVLAHAALIDEPIMICSCCLGRGRAKKLIGIGTCIQCGGTGFDIIGPNTLEALSIYRGQYERR